ncbi:phosphate acetyltransferase [Vibrio rumoiensis]|uniref:Phosphate acetyltransferase n=1 Tax=Vibrio rumoiensis 1S-45 TaxID=1188252 RepID=A0A1E5E271_9VIBR|nr:phosphate acetyltransferase [Vibrio rumoiensis]OEF25525.1 phosphate acetyltransferase [Vibrio rumoiensis 1S-45]
MKILDNIIQKAQRQNKTIVLSESQDIRILKAASTITKRKIANIVLIGDESLILDTAKQHQIELNDTKIVDPATSPLTEALVQQLFALRQHKGLTYQQATEQAANPLCFANLMVHVGLADGTVNGAVYTTADVVRNAIQIVGMDENSDLVSSFFLMMLCKPFHNLQGGLIFSDCGLVVDPNAAQLASIAIAAANSAQCLLEVEPKVAMLSFSTNGSAKHASVDKVIEAAKQVQQQCPNLAIDQDVQLDTALVSEIAERKLPTSKVKGRSNVLIFPNLEAGNIGYKLAERLASAVAIGPLLQGLKKPANDLSRGCNVEDIINVVAVTAVQSTHDHSTTDISK